MTVEELIEEVKLETGQFRLDNFEFDVDEFTKLLNRRVFKTFGNYIPYPQIQHKTFSNSSYTYTSDIPDWISSVKFAGDITVTAEISYYQSEVKFRNSDIRKTRLLWEYRKPTLYTNFGGEFEIKAIYNPTLVGDGKDAVITYVADEDLEDIIELASAWTLIAVGRNRKLITIDELPVNLNAEDMIQEGKELLEKAEQKLKDSSSTWLAIR